MKYSAIPLIDSDNKVWEIPGLVSKANKKIILRKMQDISLKDFSKASYGGKYSLRHDSVIGNELFKEPAIQELSKTIASQNVINLLSEKFLESNSNFRKALHLGLPYLKPVSKRYCIDCRTSTNNYSYIWHPDYLKLREKSQEYVQNFILAYNAVPFILDMQFSIMQPGSYIPLHTDISTKIASLMIYLPINNLQENSTLGTTFWEKKENISKSQDESKFLTKSEQDEFKRLYKPQNTKFQGNSAILFFRSDNSWHSFEYEIDDIGPRYSININLIFPNKF